MAICFLINLLAPEDGLFHEKEDFAALVFDLYFGLDCFDFEFNFDFAFIVQLSWIISAFTGNIKKITQFWTFKNSKN